ncbi:unnamed protein product [Penicillium egyptiacum]|uniref:Uncharacterized protein n=1 Tax=Penicillium egyptiacum TaxID=1303716 RepID=A0A9W4P629_9EURO|nr:unnamed protein product [Penicillium egyptiacum]
MTEPNLSPACFTKYNEQTQSNLFSLSPPEIRYDIFTYALTSASDATRPPEQDGYCMRPGYETRHRTYIELLRTCKNVYMEAWFMPFFCLEHVFRMANWDRTPGRMITVEKNAARPSLSDTRRPGCSNVTRSYSSEGPGANGGCCPLASIGFVSTSRASSEVRTKWTKLRAKWPTYGDSSEPMAPTCSLSRPIPPYLDGREVPCLADGAGCVMRCRLVSFSNTSRLQRGGLPKSPWMVSRVQIPLSKSIAAAHYLAICVGTPSGSYLEHAGISMTVPADQVVAKRIADGYVDSSDEEW